MRTFVGRPLVILAAALLAPWPVGSPTQAPSNPTRERAKALGVKMGCKPKLTSHQQKEAIERRDRGEPIRDIARSYNLHNSTISRLTA